MCSYIAYSPHLQASFVSSTFVRAPVLNDTIQSIICESYAMTSKFPCKFGGVFSYVFNYWLFIFSMYLFCVLTGLPLTFFSLWLFVPSLVCQEEYAGVEYFDFVFDWDIFTLQNEREFAKGCVIHSNFTVYFRCRVLFGKFRWGREFIEDDSCQRDNTRIFLFLLKENLQKTKKQSHIYLLEIFISAPSSECILVTIQNSTMSKANILIKY